MDIGKSFAFVFEDQKWIEKVLIGGAITFVMILFSWTIIVPILGSALLIGYMVELVRNVRRGEVEPLPVWDEWGEKIGLGIKLFVVYLIWSLPLIIVATPASILSAMSEDAATIISICFSCLAFLYGIVYYLAMPAITIQFSDTGRISSGLEFSKILEFTRENLGNVIIAMIIIWLVQLFASVVGLLLCGVGLFFTMFWATLVQGHLYGQIGRDVEPISMDELEAGYDLSPDDVMPGVGELTDEVQTGADEAVVEVTEIAESVEEVTDATEVDVVEGSTDEEIVVEVEEVEETEEDKEDEK